MLGRRRTGDETYVANLLRVLPSLAAGELRLAAVTRRPELVPEGVEPVCLPARSQEVRMAWSLPRLLRRLRPALAHFQYAIPPACPCPAVVTIHDLSFERQPGLMGLTDRLTFRTFVPRAARRAERVLTVSERTKRDLVEVYGLEPSKVVVAPSAPAPAFTPDGGGHDGYALFVGAIQKRKNPLAAVEAAAQAGLRLVAAGPPKEPELARELVRRGADVRGYVETDELVELYRRAACFVLPSRFEGLGLPVLEAMACGTPVVAADEPALREVGGDAALYADPPQLADAIRRALAERERLVAAGLERARRFSWEETGRKVLDVYRALL